METNHLKSSLSTQSFDSCNSLFRLKQSHAQLLKSPNNPSNLSLMTKLVASYGKFGDLESAHLVFHRYPRYPDAFLFNSLIQAHISNSLFRKAVEIYVQMINIGIFPNQYTFPMLFRACASSAMLHQGIWLHAHAAKFGFSSNRFVVVALMDMYMKNGVVDVARQLFDGMVERDVVSWNALLTGYSQNGYPEEALEVFNRMKEESMDANFVSVASVIAACSQLRLLNLVYCSMIKRGSCMEEEEDAEHVGA